MNLTSSLLYQSFRKILRLTHKPSRIGEYTYFELTGPDACADIIEPYFVKLIILLIYNIFY